MSCKHCKLANSIFAQFKGLSAVACIYCVRNWKLNFLAARASDQWAVHARSWQPNLKDWRRSSEERLAPRHQSWYVIYCTPIMNVALSSTVVVVRSNFLFFFMLVLGVVQNCHHFHKSAHNMLGGGVNGRCTL